MKTMLLAAVLVLVGLASAQGQAGRVADDGVLPNRAGNQDKEGAETDCECVVYYRCSDQVSEPDTETQTDTNLGRCDSALDVCCHKNNVLREDDVPSSETATSTTPQPSYTSPARCGQRNPEGVGFRITGDKDGEAQYGEFPWMVALLREEDVDGSDQRLNVYQCGGSLIHPQVVLTAAHCVAGKTLQELKVRAGEWDARSGNEIFPHQDRLVSEVIMHEGYHKGALYNDIAILILNEAVAEAENVGVVCLPTSGENLDHSRCFASGWGQTAFDKEGNFESVMKKVELPIVPRDKCLEALRKTRLGSYFKLHESFICAGAEADTDTCKGDGGSPLVCPLLTDPLHYQQAGIVSWGIGCGQDQTPGVYSSVAHFRKWIDRKITENNLN